MKYFTKLVKEIYPDIKEILVEDNFRVAEL